MGGDLGPSEVVQAGKIVLSPGQAIAPIVIVCDQAVLEPPPDSAGP